MDDLYTIFAVNLAELRKNSKMTQSELGDKVGYTYKAVSKWERGESLPDLETVKTIADLYGVTVDYLLEKEHSVTAVKQRLANKMQNNRIIIAALMVTIVWLLATTVYVYCGINSSYYPWQAFVWAVPASCLALRVFMGKYLRSRVFSLVNGSVFIWSFLASAYLQVLQYNVWLIFIMGVPLQIAVILFSRIK